MKSRGPIIAAAASLVLAILVAVGLILPKTNEVKTVQHAGHGRAGQDRSLQLQVDQLEDPGAARPASCVRS